MKHVLKYTITDSKQALQLPVGAVILSVIEQEGLIVLYALVDVSPKTTSHRLILTLNTGEPIDSQYDKVFIGTVKIGRLVHHVFEIITDEKPPRSTTTFEDMVS